MKHEITSLNTKKALAESLKKIMRKKTLSKITVTEIVTDCGVNRKTFYYHFEDIYDLLKWILESEAFEIVKSFDLILDYQDALIFVMDYIEQNEHIINCVYDAIGREEMKRFFFADFNEIIASIIDNAEKEFNATLSPEYKKFLCNFYIEALSGILIDWIKHRMETNREQTIKYLFDTIRLSLMGIMSKNSL